MKTNFNVSSTQSNNSDSLWAIGLMTGTVLDGYIDVALLRTDGEHIQEFGPYSLEPYESDVVELLREALQVARAWQFKGVEPSIFAEAEKQISEHQAKAIENVLQRENIKPDEISIIGFHGQSVLHRPPSSDMPGRTRQLGDGELMSKLLGIPVAWDFRSNDVASGGQGAPLAPVYHRALLRKAFSQELLSTNTAVLNLGGVSNLTWTDCGNHLVAFDTGPANAPINDWVGLHSSEKLDVDGKLATRGQVNEKRLAKLLQHPYLSQAYPKSLDRFDFSHTMADGLNLEDGAALLTAFSASAVGKALDLLPSRPETLVLCGGGRHNPALVSAIRDRARVKTVDADEVGWRGDAVEAECFAFLAMRVLRDMPLSFPSTTGVSAPCCGGRLAGMRE